MFEDGFVFPQDPSIPILSQVRYIMDSRKETRVHLVPSFIKHVTRW